MCFDLGLCIQGILIIHVLGTLNICSVMNLQYFFMKFKLRNCSLYSAECLLKWTLDLVDVLDSSRLKWSFFTCKRYPCFYRKDPYYIIFCSLTSMLLRWKHTDIQSVNHSAIIFFFKGKYLIPHRIQFHFMAIDNGCIHEICKQEQKNISS